MFLVSKKKSGGQSIANKSFQPYVACAGLIFVLTGCAYQTTSYVHDPAGFWVGLWNGATIAFSMVGHLIDNSIRIYTFPNNGGWYDFGYVLGVGAWGVVGGGVRAVMS
jgi:hypothetical protein